jgi:acyl-CoA reductase-like NAD-dependent aldehyde dehydrogenase
MQIIGRSVGAALAMGNACVLKPAEDACLTAMAFGQIATDAGLPAGALNIVTGLGQGLAWLYLRTMESPICRSRDWSVLVQ